MRIDKKKVKLGNKVMGEVGWFTYQYRIEPGSSYMVLDIACLLSGSVKDLNKVLKSLEPRKKVEGKKK